MIVQTKRLIKLPESIVTGLIFALFVCFIIGKSSGAIYYYYTDSELRHLWTKFMKNSDKIHISGNYPYLDCFKKSAKKYNLPLPLLLAIARGESDFNPKAVSIANCYGIMQIKWPITAKDLGIKRKEDLFNPCLNIDAGARYLAWLIKKYNGDLYFAISAYNVGPARVTKNFVPKNGRQYASYIYQHLQYIITKKYQRLQKLLLLEFTYYRNALIVMNYLKEKLKDVRMDIFKSEKYTYDIYILYSSEKELKRAIKSLQEKVGLKPLGKYTF